MKLLLLTTDVNIVGGIENVISQLTNFFVKEYGYEIEIMSLYGNPNMTPHFNFDSRIKLSFANLKTQTMKNKLDEITKDLKLKKEILNRIKNKDFDIIMTFHYPISISVILNKKYISGKIIVTEHSDYHHGIGRLDMIKRKITYRKADKVVVLNEHNKKIYKNFLDNVEVIGNPRPFTSEKISSQKNNRIITAGRLEYEKGFDRIIEIFNDSFIRDSNWRLDIYGDGRQKEELIKMIEKYDLEDIIKIHPFTNKIKEEFLKSCIYVLPSRTEAFSVVLLEAMECGLPCVSFDLSGPREIIKNGEDGFIVKENNNNDFREKLKILMSNHELRDLYSKNAKENVKRFDIKNIAIKWEELFNEI